jgi:hypothetical protein
MDASREQFARQTRRPIFSLEAVRPSSSVPSPLRVKVIRGLRRKPIGKSDLALGENPRRLRNTPCRVTQEVEECF